MFLVEGDKPASEGCNFRSISSSSILHRRLEAVVAGIAISQMLLIQSCALIIAILRAGMPDNLFM